VAVAGLLQNVLDAVYLLMMSFTKLAYALSLVVQFDKLQEG